MDVKLYTDWLKLKLNGVLRETTKAQKDIVEAIQRLGEYTEQTGDEELEAKIVDAMTAVTEAANKVREAWGEAWER